MPEAIFEDEDLLTAIINETGCLAEKIIKKHINSKGKLVVIWR